MPDSTHVPAFVVKQKVTMMVNRYEVLAPDAGGQILAFAEQKRMAMKEQVTFFADSTKSQPVFGFKARSVVDLGAAYDVTDAHGQTIGTFRKDFGASLLRTTFVLEQPGLSARGQERNAFVALVRRFSDIPLPVHFDFTDESGRTVMTSERAMSLRDSYRVSVPDSRLDFRLAAAVAVGLDALMGR